MKINSSLKFLQECVIPYLPDRSLFLLDSWTTFGSERVNNLLNNLPGKKFKFVVFRRIQHLFVNLGIVMLSDYGRKSLTAWMTLSSCIHLW